MAEEISFQLLGPVDVLCDGRPVAFGHAKARELLAVLVLQANSAISTEALIDRLWSHNPPRTARSVLYSYLSRIRSTVTVRRAGVDGDCLLRRTAGGYMLTVQSGAIDVQRFRTHVAYAQSALPDNELAASRYREALAVWRGDPLLGIGGEWSEVAREGLNSERLAAFMACHDCELGANRHMEILSELTELAARYPTDEGVLRRLMVALYRCGRQAEALVRYESTRAQLASALGVDPCPDSQSVYRQILRADPTLLSEPVGRAGPQRQRR